MALLAAVAIKEIPLRHFNEEPVPSQAVAAGEPGASGTPGAVSAIVGD